MDNVPPLSYLPLPILSTEHLVFVLRHWPCLGNIGVVMDVLCERALEKAIQYLLSLPYTHTHREDLKHSIKQELRRTSLQKMKELASLFPRMSALAADDNGDLVAEMGPLTDYAAGLWDSHDFYFQLLHAKQMQGTIPFTFLRYCMSFRLFRNARLSFS